MNAGCGVAFDSRIGVRNLELYFWRNDQADCLVFIETNSSFFTVFQVINSVKIFTWDINLLKCLRIHEVTGLRVFIEELKYFFFYSDRIYFSITSESFFSCSASSQASNLYMNYRAGFAKMHVVICQHLKNISVFFKYQM